MNTGTGSKPRLDTHLPPIGLGITAPDAMDWDGMDLDEICFDRLVTSSDVPMNFHPVHGPQGGVDLEEVCHQIALQPT